MSDKALYYWIGGPFDGAVMEYWADGSDVSVVTSPPGSGPKHGLYTRTWIELGDKYGNMTRYNVMRSSSMLNDEWDARFRSFRQWIQQLEAEK